MVGWGGGVSLEGSFWRGQEPCWAAVCLPSANRMSMGRAGCVGVFGRGGLSWHEERIDRPSLPILGLEPQDLKVQTLGNDSAVVTWHVDRGTHLGRRTAVVKRLDGSWRIVSYHASNTDK